MNEQTENKAISLQKQISIEGEKTQKFEQELGKVTQYINHLKEAVVTGEEEDGLPIFSVPVEDLKKRIGQCNRYIKAINKHRLEITRPIKNFADSIKALADAEIEPLQKEIEVHDQNIRRHTAVLTKRAAEKQRKIEEAARKERERLQSIQDQIKGYFDKAMKPVMDKSLTKEQAEVVLRQYEKMKPNEKTFAEYTGLAEKVRQIILTTYRAYCQNPESVTDPSGMVNAEFSEAGLNMSVEFEFKKQVVKQEAQDKIGKGTRKHLAGIKVIDFNQVPKEFLQVNEQAVKAAIKAGRNVPGIEAEWELRQTYR